MISFGYNKPLRMNESLGLILKIFLPPVYILAWWDNLDNVKSTILFIIALIGACIQIFHKAYTNWQNRRIKRMDIEEREKKK